MINAATIGRGRPGRAMAVAILLLSLAPVPGTPARAQGEATGIFEGDYTGCSVREDLLRFYGARQSGDVETVSDLLTAGTCFPLGGRTYEAIRVGFRTSLVRIALDGRLVEVYAPTDALRASPPAERGGYFNF